MQNRPRPGDGDFGRYPHGQSWQQSPVSSDQPGFGPQSPVAAPNPSYSPPPKKRSGLIAGLVIGLVVLLGLGTGAYFLFRGDDKKTAASPASASAAPAAPAVPTSQDDLM